MVLPRLCRASASRALPLRPAASRHLAPSPLGGAPVRRLRGSAPAQVGPLLAGIGVAAVAYGTRLLLQAAANPKFQQAMRGEPPPAEREDKAHAPRPRDKAQKARPPPTGSYFTTDAMGVDLGEGWKDWSGACAAIHEGDNTRVVENEQGHRMTPAVVAFSENGETLLGLPAKKLLFSSRATTVYGHSLLLGLRFNSEACTSLLHELRERIPPAGGGMPFDVHPSPDGAAAIRVHGTLHTPAELSSRTLAALKASAERIGGRTVTVAVAGIPSTACDDYRQAMRMAGTRAGLQRLELLPSAVAAALCAASEFPSEMQAASTVAVLEVGGLSSSLTLLRRVSDGHADVKSETEWDVVAAKRQRGVGSDALDTALVQHMVDGFRNQHGIDLATDHLALVRLHEAAEAAKAELCSSLTAPVSLPFITADASGPKHLDLSLSRSKYSQIIEPVLDAILDGLPDAITEADLSISDIDQVLLVGGAARIEAVVDVVSKALGRSVLRSSRPEEAAALGAAIHARRLQESAFRAHA